MITYFCIGLLLIVAFKILKWLIFPYTAYRSSKKHSYKINIHNTNITKPQFQNRKQVFISFIIPAYNQEKRLPKMLNQTYRYIEQKGYDCEVIVVNDGSKDNTVQEALKFPCYCISYGKNKGKGAAGMLVAKGLYHLYLDADGATDVNEIQVIVNELKLLQKQKLGLVLGSRAHLDSHVQRTFFRNLLGQAFNMIIRYVCGVNLKDTQCGFKCMTCDTSKLVFEAMHLERWAFDVQIFMLLQRHKIPYKQIPVNWRDVQGSKLNVFDVSFFDQASLTMLRDLVMVRILYLLGVWSTSDKIKTQ